MKSSYRFFLGIDPGKSGGLAMLGPTGKPVFIAPMPETPRDMYQFFKNEIKHPHLTFALIERVHSMPQNGVRASFTFGQMYGFAQYALVAAEIAYGDITPQKWMKSYELGTKSQNPKDWKNRLKQRAQSLFPEAHITLKTADALLLAKYCFTTYRNL